MQQIILIVVVLGIALSTYLAAPRNVLIRGISKPVRAAGIYVAAGVVLIGIHVVADKVYGVDFYQTWAGLTLKEISLLPPLGYGLIAGGIVGLLIPFKNRRWRDGDRPKGSE